MKRFSLATALILVSVFISSPVFSHDSTFHEDTTLASDVMNGVDDEANRDALKKFVQHARAHIREAANVVDALVLISDFRKNPGDWIAHEGSIYLYIFTEVGEDRASSDHGEIVVFNANNSQVEGLNLHDLTDANGLKIAHELVDAINGDGFAEYTWDDPRFEGDEVNEAGKSPGTSDKVGYVLRTAFLARDTIFLLGSGFYPTPYSPESDDGCAIARGTTEIDSFSSLFNLFLMVSALFLAVSWKKIRTVKR